MGLFKQARRAAGRRGDRMELEIEAEFDPDDLKDELSDIRDRSRSFAPVFLMIKQDLRKHWAGNFTTNGLPVGGWAPLDAEYAAWKSAHFPGPTMVRSGKLFKSLSELHGHPNDIGRHEARFGTSIKYAEFHQMGTWKMPKRQLVYEPADANTRWGRWAKNYLVGDTIGEDIE